MTVTGTCRNRFHGETLKKARAGMHARAHTHAVLSSRWQTTTIIRVREVVAWTPSKHEKECGSISSEEKNKKREREREGGGVWFLGGVHRKRGLRR